MNISGAKRKAKSKADNPSLPPQSTTRDAPQISTAQQRAETMATINAALLQATDEASILAAVAEYADAQGAAGVLLNYATANENVTSADFIPVARWIFKQPFPYRVIDGSEKFHNVIIEIRDLALQTLGNILYIEDIATDERLSAENRADFLPQYAMRSEAVLGLYSGGRRQGSLIIMWHQPHIFTDEEQYVYEEIVQNLSAVVATRRAYVAEQEAREEATTLYKVSEAVNASKTYDELLRAVAVLEPQADTLYLYLWGNYDFASATDYEVAAILDMQGKSPLKPGHRLQKRDFPFSGKKFPERYWFIEDTHTDPEVDAISRASWDAMNSRAILMVRLVYGEVRIGSIAFHSAEPRSFSERKRRLALAIGDLVTAAVERIRLAQNMQAAVEAQGEAYLAEQIAREEMSLLYQASEAINTATTFAEVIKAIAPLAREIERVYLFLWEHLDYRKANYFELAAGIYQNREMPVVIGARFTESQFPIAPHVVKARQVAIEDINTHPLVDPMTRAGWEASAARALLLVALVQNQRWYGTLSFESSTPRQYSERDRRLTLAISDLVASAIVRIQAQQETAAAHAESAFMYQLAGEINAAMSYQEMVESVAWLHPDSGGIFMSFFEHLDLDLASYSETIAYSAVSNQLKKHIKPRTPIIKSTIENLRQDRVWLSEDFFTDLRFDEAGRNYYLNTPVKSGLVIPLRSGERIWGMMTFYYPEPRKFSETERRIAMGIGDLASAAVERIRLQRETIESKEEADFLYQLAEQINAATTYQEIVDSVADLQTDTSGVFLSFFENLDLNRATYSETIAHSTLADPLKSRIQYRVPMVSTIEKLQHDSVWVSEDFFTDSRFDEKARDYYRDMPVRASIVIPLRAGERLWGMMTFYYPEPRPFSEQEKRITLGIGDLVSAAVERIRLQHETVAAKEEADFLYKLAEQINAATSYQTILDSVVRLMPDAEGVFLNLFEHFDYDQATYAEIPAAANISDNLQAMVGKHIPIANFQISEELRKQRLIVVEDTETNQEMGSAIRESWNESGVRSLVIVTFHREERLMGWLFFYKSQPHHFSEGDLRRVLGIGDLAKAAVERIRLQQETVAAKDETDFLYQLAEQINAATSYQAILDSVVRLMPDAEGVFLNLCENFDFDNGNYFEVPVGANVPERFQWMIGTRVPKENFPFAKYVRDQRLVVVDNVQTDPRIDNVSRENWEVIGTRALMAVLFHREERLFGWLLFVRTEPHKFTEHDRRLALGIGDLAKAAVERIHLQQETIAANEESHFLYQLAEQINAATSYQAILDSVVHLMPEAEGVYLNLCENFDFDTARYFDVPVGANVPKNLEGIIGTRIPKIGFPFAEKIRDQRVVVVNDVQTDPMLDQVSRASWEMIGARALIAVMFHREERLFGWLLFVKSQPYHFPERDKRLALGIGDLAKAAIERIHLQQETIAAKEEADFLYQLAEQINAATSYQAILDAVVRLLPDYEGVYLNLYEHFDIDRANYFEIPVAANIPDNLKYIVGQRIAKERFPMAERLRNERLFVIEDVDSDTSADEVSRANWKVTGTRALVIVTFHREGRLLGWLFFNKSEPRQFTERDLRRTLGIGDLAKAAIERIYLQQETIIAKRQAETLANLNAAFSRAVNEIDLLRAFVPYAESIGAYRVEMTYADHFREDDPYSSNPIALWESGEYNDYRQSDHHLRHVPSKDYLLGSLWLDQPDQVMYSPDIAADSRLDEERRVWMRTTFTMGAAVVLPLVHAGEFQGLISINWSTPHIFSDDERYILESLLQTLPAVIATRRIYLSEQEARAENELLYTVGKEINRAKTNHEVMEAVNRCFPDPLYVAIFMWENYNRNKATYTETVISTDPGLPAGTRLPRDVFDLSSTVSGKVQIIHDANAPEWAEDAAAASARRFGIMSVAFTSLVENQRVVGVFAVGCKTQRNFTDREIRLMSGVTELTGAALERFRLRDETERARQRAHDLAALEERTRLARELHDSVSQALYGIGLGAQTAYRSLDKNPTIVRESVEYVLTLAEAGLAEMRALIFELRPESLETEGLVVALAKQAASIQARHGIEVQIELGDEPQMVLATKESLYRVAREALHNVVKHANATRIMLRMQSNGSLLQLDVIDNGIGFETSKDFPGHLGLHSMRERVMQMGGEISIKSAQGSGTQLSVTLPV